MIRLEQYADYNTVHCITCVMCMHTRNHATRPQKTTPDHTIQRDMQADRHTLYASTYKARIGRQLDQVENGSLQPAVRIRVPRLLQIFVWRELDWLHAWDNGSATFQGPSKVKDLRWSLDSWRYLTYTVYTFDCWFSFQKTNWVESDSQENGLFFVVYEFTIFLIFFQLRTPRLGDLLHIGNPSPDCVLLAQPWTASRIDFSTTNMMFLWQKSRSIIVLLKSIISLMFPS